MVIGSVLVRPQKLQRAIALGSESGLTDDLLSLLTIVALDAVQGGSIMQDITLAVEAIATGFVAHGGAGLSRAVDRFGLWLQPLIDRVKALAEQGNDLQDLNQVLDSTEHLLAAVVSFLQDLPTEQLRHHVNTALEIAETDLGITSAWIEQQVLGVFDEIGLRLQRTTPEQTPEQRSRRREAAILLRRIRRYLGDRLNFPELNADQIASSLIAFLKPFRNSTRKAACIGNGLAQTMRVGQSLVDLVPYAGVVTPANNRVRVADFDTAVTTSPSAAALRSSSGMTAADAPIGIAATTNSELYAWYATWLLEHENRGGFLFKLNNLLDFDEALDRQQLPDALRNEFRDHSAPLSFTPTVEVLEARKKWRIIDSYGNPRGSGTVTFKYALELQNDGIDVRLDREGAFGGTVSVLGFLGFILGFPGDKVWVNPERTKVFLGDRLLYEGTDVKWLDAPIFSGIRGPHYTFDVASTETMEGVAFHSAWVSDALEALLHLISLEVGDYASNTVNAVWNLVHMTVKLAANRPLFDSLGYWTWVIGIGATALASLEGMHTKVSVKNWFAFWLFVLLSSDLGEKALYNYWLNLARNGLLSTITLLNYDGARVEEDFVSGARDTNRPLNRKVVDGVVSIFVDLSMIWLADLVPKNKYIFPFGSADLTLGYGVGAALGMGLLGGFVGTVVAETLAWAEDWEVLGYSLLKSMLWSLGRFWPYLYLIKEGDTDGGIYNPIGIAFPGYPDSSTSPYNMPYPAGQAVLWGQCNQGMWSHHIAPGSNPQVYAFDLAMDQGDEVLAMRSGTVIDFFDWVPDDTDPSTNIPRPGFPAGTLPQPGTTSRNWNFVMIRHDRDAAVVLIPAGNLPPNANPQNSPHDRDAGGGRVVTYGVYGHGRNGSVRQIFASRLGIPVANILPSNIIGQTILKGQPIMLSGDTGVSFHNHLHIQIMVGPATGADVRLDNRTGVLAAVNPYTIPFVFQEVSGVPKVLNSYISQNIRQP